jgi:hypothetical protein
MKKQRKHHTAEEKVAILRRHLLEKEPISKLCDELGLQPIVFYRWQKEFFENGAAAFEQTIRTAVRILAGWPWRGGIWVGSEDWQQGPEEVRTVHSTPAPDQFRGWPGVPQFGVVARPSSTGCGVISANLRLASPDDMA